MQGVLDLGIDSSAWPPRYSNGPRFDTYWIGSWGFCDRIHIVDEVFVIQACNQRKLCDNPQWFAIADQ